MPLLIDTVADSDLAFATSADLEGVTLRLAFRWLDRIGVWVCIATTPEGVLLGMEQIVRPGGRILLDVRDPRIPPGRLEWRGPDPYRRADLGITVQLVYLTAAEVASG